MTLCRAVVYQPGDIIVPAADGSRKLTVRISGNPSGIPVFFLHGTPGSRIGPAPRTPVLYKLGVRLISFDRPGYGGSERQVARRVADAAEDVVAIADYLEVEQFAVLGRSGGGPHALACAALLPDRVTRAGVLVSLAPWEGMGAQWLNGMSISNRLEYTAAALEPEKLITRLVQSAGLPTRPRTSRRSRITWRSANSRCSGVREAARTRWPAPRCCLSVSSLR